eukprot:TRINITY_DN13403_c0_g1_i2.p1 TRINITY_DN13403_c0_g1~~TRINITY_DN13403_c0_g1_i2.p1  ORF type:complete len:448 (-),score=37.45 TRINITY_DN13403_c0_g1_i2:184-1527(-)
MQSESGAEDPAAQRTDNSENADADTRAPSLPKVVIVPASESDGSKAAGKPTESESAPLATADSDTKTVNVVVAASPSLLKSELVPPSSYGRGSEFKRFEDEGDDWECTVVVENADDCPSKRPSLLSIRPSLMERASVLAYATPFGLRLCRLARPIFVGAQITICALLYLIFRGEGFEPSGLDAMSPGLFRLRVVRDCIDERFQVWRWVLYQFSHVSFAHLFMNCAIALLAIPQERFQGSLKYLLMFNAGVFGGACMIMTSDVHAEVVGMSGGNYAIFGIQMADLFMNFELKEHPNAEVLFSLATVAALVIDAIIRWNESVSHSAHFGGAVGGSLACIAFGRKLKINRRKVIAKWCAIGLMCFFVVFSLSWNAQWPPRSLWDSTEPWCWWKQIYNKTHFRDTGDGRWHCVRCPDLACARKWESRQTSIFPVMTGDCVNLLGGWSTVPP